LLAVKPSAAASLYHDHTEQKAKPKHKCDDHIVHEAFFVAMSHGGFTTVHEERGDQENNGHSQTKQLVQVWTGKPKQVHADG
jgi:hypothetical protein